VLICTVRPNDMTEGVVLIQGECDTADWTGEGNSWRDCVVLCSGWLFDCCKYRSVADCRVFTVCVQ
jgi:hypothetical protein